MGVGIDGAGQFHLVAPGRGDNGAFEVTSVERTPAAATALMSRIVGLEPDPADVRVVIETSHGCWWNSCWTPPTAARPWLTRGRPDRTPAFLDSCRPCPSEETSMWSARRHPARVSGPAPRTNDIDTDERRQIIPQRGRPHHQSAPRGLDKRCLIRIPLLCQRSGGQRPFRLVGPACHSFVARSFPRRVTIGEQCSRNVVMRRGWEKADRNVSPSCCANTCAFRRRRGVRRPHWFLPQTEVGETDRHRAPRRHRQPKSPPRMLAAGMSGTDRSSPGSGGLVRMVESCGVVRVAVMNRRAAVSMMFARERIRAA